MALGCLPYSPSSAVPGTRAGADPTTTPDADDHLIPPLCRIEQIAVDAFHGAEPLRLHRYGRVIDHGITRLFVLFDDENALVRIQPHLVRVLSP